MGDGGWGVDIRGPQREAKGKRWWPSPREKTANGGKVLLGSPSEVYSTIEYSSGWNLCLLLHQLRVRLRP
ncbi:hypothetical protein DPEC_G00355570 [Dallia pectoralis]|uniref:Uncharacterized protein n=1 Tax=Dallia pectoralis TaxID=75939 RepID=A0ACC2EZK5_DALPE|nr:hypothetical protein DPEC_G00355570 [Dallia pectoralis]